MTRRDKAWYLVQDKDGQVAERHIKLDCIDIEINGLQRVLYEETKAKLERIGSTRRTTGHHLRYTRAEQRCTNRIRPDDDIEAIVTAANETALDRAYREYRAAASPAASPDRLAAGEVIVHTPPGVPLRRYFDAKITVR